MILVSIDEKPLYNYTSKEHGASEAGADGRRNSNSDPNNREEQRKKEESIPFTLADIVQSGGNITSTVDLFYVEPYEGLLSWIA